jgi:hypothetical protein
MKIPTKTPEDEVFIAILNYLEEKHSGKDDADILATTLRFFTTSMLSFIANTSPPGNEVKVLELTYNAMRDILLQKVKREIN